MPLGYYCDKCKKFVLVVSGMFNHPDRGDSPCKVCYRCRGMVYLKMQDDELEPA